ncbi:MAG: PHP domain-containing protein [Defluviitaleaceae bacterium]|nr:PHP domain-containing protein [Defluviitaleaceae bacterium]
MDKYIDLHIHSNFSDDAQYSPEELVKKCKEAGIRIMAIADHNSAKANKRAKIAAESLGIKYIPAIEMNGVFNGRILHILGYGIDYESPDFHEFEEGLKAQQPEASRVRLELTIALGFNITAEELGDVAWTGERFGEVLLAKEEYMDNELLKPYRPGGDRSNNPLVNFYWDFYSQGKPCFVDVDYLPAKEVIEIIHKNGGIAVLAHPGQNLGDNAEVLEELQSLGLDGVEAFTSYHDLSMSRLWYEKAKSLNMTITCGSDYHGKFKPNIKLGESGCWINLKEIEQKINF